MYVRHNLMEENRFSSKPMEPIETYIDFDNRILICPNCRDKINITLWTDSRGNHPNVGLTCKKCRRKYSILY